MGMRADVVYEPTRGFEVTAGARVDFFSSQGASAIGIDPRLMTRTTVSEHLRLLTALGIAHQPPAFVVPVPGFQPGGLQGGLQRSVQESLGIELGLGSGTTFTMSAFHNTFFDMSDALGVLPQTPQGCPPGSFPSGTLGGDNGGFVPGWTPFCGPRFPAGTVGPDRSGGSGQGASTRGEDRAVEAFEVRSRGRPTARMFSEAKSHAAIGRLSLVHAVSLDALCARGALRGFVRPNARGQCGCRFRSGAKLARRHSVRFYTGVPRSQDPNGADTGRLPAFFRVDLRLEKRWQLGTNTWLSLVTEWMNATLSKEAISTDCTLRGCNTQTIGPVTIPSIGLEGGF